MARLSVPTISRLSSTLRVESSNQSAVKVLNRLSREALISLALNWLDESSIANAVPYLKTRSPGEDEDDEDDEDIDDLYPACATVEDIQQLYLDMQEQKGSKRDVVSRILEGDWRHGLTMYQLAMADLTFLDENPTSHKWSAYQILPLQEPSKDRDDENILKVDQESLQVPQFHPVTFLQRLQEHVLPDVKAHYQFHRLKSHPILLLRIFVIDSPYNTSLALSVQGSGGETAVFDSSRTIFLAFPDGSPYLYITKSQRIGAAATAPAIGEAKSIQSAIVSGVPKALSRPRERYTLKPSTLSTKNLLALLDKKGPGRTNAAGGGWSIYADERQKASPLDTTLPAPPLSDTKSYTESLRKRPIPLRPGEPATKRAKVVAQARFGTSARINDGKGMEKVEIIIKDKFPGFQQLDDFSQEDDSVVDGEATRKRRRSQISNTLSQITEDDDDDGQGDSEVAQESHGWAPIIKVSLNGPHVYAGFRQLVEAGIIDGERMPGWMTGEEGVTVGMVKNGRLQGHRGSEP